MTDRPIPFTAPMVRAIIEGRTTQTRRVLKPQPKIERYRGREWCSFHGHGGSVDYLMREIAPRFWTPYQPGDRLYVREAWRAHAMFDHLPPREITTTSIHYEADGSVESGRYRHARFMPRRLSRLTLVVTDVKVERLQEISEEDAEAESCEAVGGQVCHDPPEWDRITAKENFAVLWDEINGKREGCRWADNPWIVAPSFTAHLCNIDSLPLELAS